MGNRNVNRTLVLLLIADLVWLFYEIAPDHMYGMWRIFVGVVDFNQRSQAGWITMFSLLILFSSSAKIYPDLQEWLNSEPDKKHRRKRRAEKDNLSPALKKELDARRRRGY